MKGVDRAEHVKSGKGARLALVTTLVRMGWVTLGATPWACCARYVRYTRKGFPPQTRPPSQSSRRSLVGTVEFVKSRNSSPERVVSRVRETGCRYHSTVPPVRWHWLPGGTEEDGVWSRCWLGAGLSRSSHSPPPSARLHSYSPPFDLHVGSNCGAASPARHPGTSSARPAAPRHSCISTLPARLAPSNTCKYNTNTNQIQIKYKYKHRLI